MVGKKEAREENEGGGELRERRGNGEGEEERKREGERGGMIVLHSGISWRPLGTTDTCLSSTDILIFLLWE
jgi:hypothetical protein